MNVEAVLMSAFALAVQGRYDEAERLLESCPEAVKSVSGQDLLARIRFAQGETDLARQIWDGILAVDPANPEAKSALDALAHPIPDPPRPWRKFVVAGAIAVSFGIAISIVRAMMASAPVAADREPCTAFVTNVVERVLTNTIVKVETRVVEVERPVERVVTNIVDRTVEVEVVSVVTQYVDRVDGNNMVQTAVKGQVAEAEVDEPTPYSETPGRIHYPVYVIRQGDRISRLAEEYGFRMPDFKAVNPDVDPNHVIPGQMVRIPLLRLKGETLK